MHCLRIRPYNERESDVIYVTLDSTKRVANSILGAMKEYEQINANFDEYVKNIAHTKAQNKPNIVLVIGESAQRNLMQIYGYALPNTPIFSAMKAQNKGNLFIFDNVISAQVTTFESLSQALTFANQDNPNKQWFEYLNLIDAMRLGGYKSVVISNQERFSLWSKATTTIFSRADKLIWSEDSIAGKRLDTMGFDGAILPILDSVLELSDLLQKDNENGGLFLTLHLMGSHVGYSNRYPKEFEQFLPRNITRMQNPRAKVDLAEYANSILYTDFVLCEIIKRFADKDSIVIYTSDHANDVWDTGEGSLRVDTKITRFMVEVPFVVFVSDEFKKEHQQVYKRIASAMQKPFMIDDLIHAIIDIAGFKIDGYESTRSVFSDDFNTKRIRMVGTKANVDYDKELKDK